MIRIPLTVAVYTTSTQNNPIKHPDAWWSRTYDVPHPRAKTSRAKLHGGTSSIQSTILLPAAHLLPPKLQVVGQDLLLHVLVGSLLFLLLFFWFFGSPNRTTRGLVVISNPSSNLLRCWVLTEPLQIRHVNQSSFDVRSLN